MKKVISIVLVLAALLALLFGALKPVNFFDTLEGMRKVVEGAPGTFIYAKENLIVLSWPQGLKYAFVVVTRDGSVFEDLAKICNGQKCNWKAMTDFVKWLEGQGFQQIFPEALPVGMVTTLSGWGTMMVIVGKSALPNLFILPAGLMPENNPLVPTGVVQ